MFSANFSGERLLERLQPPSGPVSMVLDTDTYNEIDDQFAVVYSLLSDNLNVEAIYAAPFFNRRSTGPGDGMLKSYEEILRLLERLGHPHEGFAFHGSDRYLERLDTPVPSEAVDDLIARAMQPRDGPLYVVPIGAITNIASALLIEPEITERIVVVWLGGQPWYWPHTREFNLEQDVLSARVVFDCGVPVVQIPCKNVAEHLRTTVPEMETYVRAGGPLAFPWLRLVPGITVSVALLAAGIVMVLARGVPETPAISPEQAMAWLLSEPVYPYALAVGSLAVSLLAWRLPMRLAARLD